MTGGLKGAYHDMGDEMLRWKALQENALPEAGPVEHKLNGFCWCQPLVETDLVTGGQLYIHRRSIDSSHIEPDR